MPASVVCSLITNAFRQPALISWLACKYAHLAYTPPMQCWLLELLQKEAVVDMLQLDTAGWHGAITGGAAGTEAAAADAANDWLKDSQSLKESQSIKRRQPAAGRRA